MFGAYLFIKHEGNKYVIESDRGVFEIIRSGIFRYSRSIKKDGKEIARIETPVISKRPEAKLITHKERKFKLVGDKLEIDGPERLYLDEDGVYKEGKRVIVIARRPRGYEVGVLDCSYSELAIAPVIKEVLEFVL